MTVSTACAALTREISDTSATLLTMSALIIVSSGPADYISFLWKEILRRLARLRMTGTWNGIASITG
jgi:hypothetical protein